jgi:predicted heme/steroid binding protein
MMTREETFNMDRLAQFDGKDGRPAYVAVDGVIYDVSASQYWPEGAHWTCDLGAVAGKDLSEEIKQAPERMRSELQQMPVVRKLAI